MKIILFIFFLKLIFLRASCQDSLYTRVDTSECNVPFLIFVDEQAKFQGGDLQNFREWLYNNFVLSSDNKDIGHFPRVTFQFIVNDTGKVVCVKILRPDDVCMEQEIIRMMDRCPDWIPAKHKGKNVNQMFVAVILD